MQLYSSCLDKLTHYDDYADDYTDHYNDDYTLQKNQAPVDPW